jgi:hypothetical protein
MARILLPFAFVEWKERERERERERNKERERERISYCVRVSSHVRS